LCIVDEASKALSTEALVPMSRARRWVLVGDERQLPPFIDDELRDKRLLSEYGLTLHQVQETLFSHLKRHLPPSCVVALKRQYRMAPAIGDLVSSCFYDGAIESAPKKAKRYSPVLSRPVTWLSTSPLSSKGETRVGKSWKNMAEVTQIVGLVKRLEFVAEKTGQRSSIAIMSGYLAQTEELQRALQSVASSLTWCSWECGTVDTFQGKEAEIAVFSTVRSNPEFSLGFLSEMRRINVALSRAKEALVIVGDYQFFSSAPGENPLLSVTAYIRDHPADCVLKEALQ
jgi:superfamily I DNA and/or RNA helicase